MTKSARTENQLRLLDNLAKNAGYEDSELVKASEDLIGVDSAESELSSEETASNPNL